MPVWEAVVPAPKPVIPTPEAATDSRQSGYQRRPGSNGLLLAADYGRGHKDKAIYPCGCGGHLLAVMDCVGTSDVSAGYTRTKT